MFTGSFDLAAVPRWRRKRFEINKLRYAERKIKRFLNLNGTDTIFRVVGERESNYIYSSKFEELSSILSKIFSSEYRFELFQMHSLDTLQHWNLDNPDRINKFYSKIDNFSSELHRICTEKNITLMILSDHGMEPVKDSIDILKELKRLGIPRDEFTYFIEASKARLYFHTDYARERVLALLSSIEQGTILSYKEMHDYNVKFEDKSYGEYYFILNPGYIFFPNDYYHPLGNLFLGFTDWQKRNRLRNPKYRGYHGYLPHNESEKGLLLLLDNKYKAKQRIAEIIDFAPTVLSLLGYDRPEIMKGECIFL